MEQTWSNNGRNHPSEVTENPGGGCSQRGVLTGVSVGCSVTVLVSGFGWVFSCGDLGRVFSQGIQRFLNNNTWGMQCQLVGFSHRWGSRKVFSSH